MNNVITKITFVLAVTCCSCLGFEAKACVCMPQRTPYREYQDARAVFVGKVIGSKDVAVTEKLRDKTYTANERIFQFSVDESLKGLKTSTAEINVGRTDSDCYQGFTVGKSYLVYAFGDSNSSLESGTCTRTTQLSNAAADLHYLRELLKAVPEPRIYGAVVRVDSDLENTVSGRRVTALPSIKVLIEGKSKNFEAVTDEHGLYSLAQVRDGKYKAHPLLPKEYMTYFPSEVEFILGSGESLAYERIQQGSSAYASFEIGWNNHLNGRVVNSEGNPIVRVKLSVLAARSPSPSVVERDDFTITRKGSSSFMD